MVRFFNYVIIIVLLIRAGNAFSGEQSPGNNPDADLKELPALVDQFQERIRSLNYDYLTESLYSDLVNLLGMYPDTVLIAVSEGYYYAAVYNQNYRVNNPDSAISMFLKSRSIRAELELFDEIYSKCCSNLGLLYLSEGDPITAINFSEEGLKVRESIYKRDTVLLLTPLLNLSASYIAAGDNDLALATALKGVEIIYKAGLNNDIQNLKFYTNAGIACANESNFSTSESYLKVAYNNYMLNSFNDPSILTYIINGLAVSYRMMGDTEKSIEYFKKGADLIEQIDYNLPDVAFTLLSNYGYLLVTIGDLDGAEKLLNNTISLSRQIYGEENINYQTQLENLAFFLSIYKGDNERGMQLYRGLEKYVQDNPWNKSLRNSVYYGYAQTLFLSGKPAESIGKLNEILLDPVLADNKTRLNALTLKREVLYYLYLKEGSISFLEEALEVITEAVEIYDMIRNDMSNEMNHLKLNARFNFVYEDCIGTLNQLYAVTGNPVYLEQSFNYSEKAKAASLLASTRQSRAMKFHIPEELSKLERKLERDAKTLSELIYNENSAREPDMAAIARYEEMRLTATMKDDSLKRVFENDYPRYNSLKNSTAVSGFQEVRKSVGRKANFIEYFVTDTILNIYLVNRDKFEIHTVPYTSELQQDLLSLREIIIHPAIESGARKQYSDYTRLAYSIYNTIFKPLEESFISDRLIIAPDGLLSYIPFEALLTGEISDGSMNYRKLPFMVDSYDIVYAYSGTLLAETGKSGRSLLNPALTFAPEYNGEVMIDSILVARQQNGGMLKNIPGAREEAISVNELLGGELFLGSQATETIFKERAPEGQIIHLAMHTLLNDSDPMYSKMVFNLDDSSPNDGRLNTYEVYDIPLEARMVVLSSCNTGSGYLQSGEGVMSLARGFFYSGAPTVVMSLWEVDDRSGSQIIKQFYSNLKRGVSKSTALRKARVKYLRGAEQMRSHPYFWCTLVIMGDDSPVFINRTMLTVAILLLVAFSAGLIWRYRFRLS